MLPTYLLSLLVLLSSAPAGSVPSQTRHGCFRASCHVFVKQPRLVGSLLTAMVEFSKLNAGMQVSYVEMTTVSVTLVGNEATKVYCALFHDRQDGATFGRLIASEVSFFRFHCFHIPQTSPLAAVIALTIGGACNLWRRYTTVILIRTPTWKIMLFLLGSN